MRLASLFFVAVLAFPPLSAGAVADADILQKQSPHSVDETIQRFEAAVRDKGMIVFPRLDHAQAARAVGLTMPPTVVVPFGNPRFGTPRMIEAPLAAIDFPPRALVYEDASGQVWIAYQSADYLFNTVFTRHGLDFTATEVETFRTTLDALTDRAVEKAP